jgi:ABC-type transport system involved in multi-copper enzyme maturation permease subunit
MSTSAVISALFRKELRSFLGNPTGYVFLTLFIVASAAAAFLTDSFFSRNLADLATLNRWMPAILMFFVPAITMGLWADERRSGTDELLLTLPVRDGEVVMGKFLGALGVYTVGLLFSLVNVAVLAYLGDPDSGLMFATYLGYWLMGALFVAVGMMGSMFTANTTVAFILGALGCAALVFSGSAPWASAIVGVVLLGVAGALKWAVMFGRGASIGATLGVVFGLVLWLGGFFPWFSDIFARLGAPGHFASFGEGVLRLGDIAFFAGGTAVALYICSILISRRHW